MIFSFNLGGQLILILAFMILLILGGAVSAADNVTSEDIS